MLFGFCYVLFVWLFRLFFLLLMVKIVRGAGEKIKSNLGGEKKNV